MLLRLYHLYQKSPKKVRQLKEIFENLKEVYEFNDGASSCIPVQSQGSHWISHKRKALQKVVDQYGVYIFHSQKKPSCKKTNARSCNKKGPFLAGS